MSEYHGEDRTARACNIIGAAAMCVAATVLIALMMTGAKRAPAQRGEDPTLIRSVLESHGIHTSVATWAGIRR